MSYHSSIIRQTEENDNFRTVLFTGKKSQLMVMSIPPGGVIGMETHEHVEQTLFFLSGSGKAVLNGEESAVVAGCGAVGCGMVGQGMDYRNHPEVRQGLIWLGMVRCGTVA
jgi:mannose-6-phosphate isomerase-like protein (cupin superfamily)